MLERKPRGRALFNASFNNAPFYLIRVGRGC